MSQLRFLLFFVGVPLVLTWGAWFGLSRLLTGAPIEPPRSCDGLYVRVNAEVANDLDRVLRGGRTECGSTGAAREVVDCVIALHAGDENPLAPDQPAFVAIDGGAPLEPCQVGLTPVATNAIRFEQQIEVGQAKRSFRIAIE